MLGLSSLVYMTDEEREGLSALLGKFALHKQHWQLAREQTMAESSSLEFSTGNFSADIEAAHLDHSRGEEILQHSAEEYAQITRDYYHSILTQVMDMYAYGQNIVDMQRELAHKLDAIDSRYGDMSYSEHFTRKRAINTSHEKSYHLMREFTENNYETLTQGKEEFDKAMRRQIDQLYAAHIEVSRLMKAIGDESAENPAPALKGLLTRIEVLEETFQQDIAARMKQLTHVISECERDYINPLSKLAGKDQPELPSAMSR